MWNQNVGKADHKPWRDGLMSCVCVYLGGWEHHTALQALRQAVKLLPRHPCKARDAAPLPGLVHAENNLQKYL